MVWTADREKGIKASFRQGKGDRANSLRGEKKEFTLWGGKKKRVIKSLKHRRARQEVKKKRGEPVWSEKKKRVSLRDDLQKNPEEYK